jgi:hypothetical protein
MTQENRGGKEEERGPSIDSETMNTSFQFFDYASVPPFQKESGFDERQRVTLRETSRDTARRDIHHTEWIDISNQQLGGGGSENRERSRRHDRK